MAAPPVALTHTKGLNGRVLGPDGKGLAKATVTLRGFSEQMLKQIPEGMRAMWLAQVEKQVGGALSQMLESQETTTTDAKGRFHLAGAKTPKDPHWLSVQHPTHVNVFSSSFTKEIKTPVEVTLVQGATLTVRLVAPGGAKVEQPNVTVAPEDPESLGKVVSRSLNFSYDLTFETPDHSVQTAQAKIRAAQKGTVKTETQVDKAVAEDSEESAALAEASSSGEDEALVEEASASDVGKWVQLISGDTVAVASDDSSVRVFEGVPPGSLKVSGSAQGFRTTSETILLSSGESRELTISLEVGLAISGHVRSRSGKPIGEAHVSAFSMGGQSRRQIQATSDAQGAFTLRGLEDASYQVSAYAEGYEYNYRQARSVRPGGEPLVILLDDTYHVRGRVLGPDGQPAAQGLQVSAKNTKQRYSAVAAASTGEGGTFDLAGLSAGTHVITVSGGDMTTLDPVTVVIKSADVEGVEVKVASGASAKVVVTDRGIPVAGVSLSVASGVDLANNYFGRRMAQTGGQETDEKGVFVLKGLAPGEYEISARKEGFAPAKAVLVVDSDQEPRDVRIALVAGAVLQCRVLHADGTPFASKMIMIIPKDASLSSPAAFENTVSTSPEGRFEKKGLAAGNYMLQCLEMTSKKGGSGLRPIGEVRLEPSQTTSVELRLEEASASVTGVVIKAGKPLAGTQVAVYREGNLMAGFARTMTDDEGRFSAEGLSAGTYVVSANGAAKTSVTLSNNTPVEVRLEIKAGVVAGSLIGPDGQPAVAAGVTLQRLDEVSLEDTFKPQSQTDDLGTFRIEDVRPGRYRLLSHVPGVGATRGIEFTLGADEARTGLELKLGVGGGLTLEVMRADGKPAAGAQITLYHLELAVFSNQIGGWNAASTPVTNRHGKATLTHLIPGTYALFVGSTSHQMAVVSQIQVSDGASQTRRLDLTPGGSLEIQGPPGSTVEVSLAGSKAPLGGTGSPWAQLFGLAKTGPDGTLTLPYLPAVQVEVRVKTPEGRTLGPWKGAITSGDTAIATLR
ncbi:MAG: carboxypeptidase regulatory-like domain-containing protein [Planctomycetes bacterium]|nr:carboxypeptidase regulatory-like domain-containing protein [Planctomycetota bacterium]